MDELHNNAIKYVSKNLTERTLVEFNNNFFSFYDDTCGQRLYRIEPYKGYDKTPIYGMFRVIRKLAFTNQIDEGKEGAILGILNLTHCDFVSLHKDKVVFDNITIYLK